MNVLLLGGTYEAVQVARNFTQMGINVTYSIAGLLRNPQLNCKVISGGFSQYGGLTQFIKINDYQLILDMTHPYASKISNTAFESCVTNNIICWRYERIAWQPHAEDRWYEFSDWKELWPKLQRSGSILFAAGRLDDELIQKIELISDETSRHVVRSATRPMHTYKNIQWIEQIGPFNLNDEMELFERYNIKSLVCKNSGGSASVAKIVAARKHNIPVFLLKRPKAPRAHQTFFGLSELKNAMSEKCQN